MIKQLKIYFGDCVDPYRNLATEKWLFDTNPADTCTLYLWQNENTVVIGRNQNPWAECRPKFLEENGIKLARRLSGGGAVFHDLGNLNFTFICSTENYDLAKNLEVVKLACKYAGITAEVSGRNDILVDGKKFSGNAFYNSKGMSYHHGTLLINADIEKVSGYLTPSKAKLEAKGIKSVRSRVINLSSLAPDLTCEKMKEYMCDAFSKVFNLPVEEMVQIDQNYTLNLSKKYSSWDYIYGESKPFSVSVNNRFPWGSVTLNLDVKDGIIMDSKLYTDAMFWELPTLVESALFASPLQDEKLKNKLFSTVPLPYAEDILNLIKSI